MNRILAKGPSAGKPRGEDLLRDQRLRRAQRPELRDDGARIEARHHAEDAALVKAGKVKGGRERVEPDLPDEAVRE